MLGAAISDYCQRKSIDYVAFSHTDLDVTNVPSVSVALQAHNARTGDVLINCAGLREESHPSPIDMVMVNGAAPHILASESHRMGMRMWQISTDCVFGAQREPHRLLTGYRAQDNPSPTSLYGRSKLAGEIQADHVVVIRTSFAGPDHGIWRWIQAAEKGALIEGWSRAFWSGSTVWEVVRNLFEIPYNVHGVYHLATGSPISKLHAITLLAYYLRRDDLRIVSSPRIVDRALDPTIEMNSFEQGLISYMEHKQCLS